MAGSLRSNLCDLYEAQNWGFAAEKAGAPPLGCQSVTFALMRSLATRSFCRAVCSRKCPI